MIQTVERAEYVGESIDLAVQQYCEEAERFDTTTKGDAFVVWCLTDLFGFDRDEAVNRLVGQGNDRVIDAVADDGNRLIVIQGRYNSHLWGKIPEFQQSAKSITEGTAQKLPQRIAKAAAEIRSRFEAGKPVEYYYFTNEKFTGDDDAKLPTLPTDPTVQAMDLDEICKLLHERESGRAVDIPSQALLLRANKPPLEFEDSLVMPVSIYEFARFVAPHLFQDRPGAKGAAIDSRHQRERWLFNSNIRQYLSKSPVNKEIAMTVKTSPQDLWRFNNGITMVVDSYSVQDKQVSLIKPQIVNGCQTSLALVRTLEAMSFGERQSVKGSLMVRVIRERDDEERKKITRFTNKQNAAKGKDFFALEAFQNELKKRVDRLGYFYEIQIGSFNMLSKAEKARLKGEARYKHLDWKNRDYRIPAIEAAKCHGAGLLGKVAPCYGNPGDFAPGGELYDDVFPPNLPSAPEMYVLPFLLMKHAEAHLKYGARAGEEWRRRGKYVFVNVALRTLQEALKKADRGGMNDELTAPLLREVFSSEPLTVALVSLSDDIVDRFFTDGEVAKLIGTDIFKFLKKSQSPEGKRSRSDSSHGIEDKAATQVLDTKIAERLRREDGRIFVELLQKTLPA